MDQKRILYLLVVGNMDMTFFLTKFRVLVVDENGYARGPKKDIILATRGRKRIWPFLHEG